MKQWIGYYKDVVSHETCDSIMSENWEWKSSTYSSNKGEIEDIPCISFWGRWY